MTVAAMQPAPFVNAEYMARHNGRVVRLVGTLMEAAPGTVQLKSSDNAVVTVRVHLLVQWSLGQRHAARF